MVACELLFENSRTLGLGSVAATRIGIHGDGLGIALVEID